MGNTLNDCRYLQDIVKSIRRIEQYLKDVDKKSFKASHQLQDAVVKRLEVIGEAAGKISEEIKAKYPETLWKSMYGMRNVLIHDYDSISLDIVWDTVVDNLPLTKKQIERIIKEHCKKP